MEISPRLAEEIYTIVLMNTVTIIILICFSALLITKSKKNPLLRSYLLLASSLILWMVAKVLKTLSPTLALRWFFVVIQYIGVFGLGPLLILFALVYRIGRFPSLKIMGLIGGPALLSWIIVLTNPLHMLFYAHFDIYRDGFGPLFFVTQTISYSSLLVGVLMLIKSNKQVPIKHNNKWLANLMAILAMLAICGNVYYLLVKLTPLKWVGNFPFFDFTPITSSLALVLFVMPAIRYRFFDLSPIGFYKVFNTIPEGIVLLHNQKTLFSFNQAMANLFSFVNPKVPMALHDFIHAIPFEEDHHKADLFHYLSKEVEEAPYVLDLMSGASYRVYKYPQFKNYLMILFKDETIQMQKHRYLLSQQDSLEEANRKLNNKADLTRNLLTTKVRTQIAQNVHDILGHSLTVVIATLELAILSKEEKDMLTTFENVKVHLLQSLEELKNSVQGQAMATSTSLIERIQELENEAMLLEVTVQGNPYELNNQQTEAVFRVCQEAMTNSIKHGHAKQMEIIIRYKVHDLEIYLVDDGLGCLTIVPNHGINGMIRRIERIKGTLVYGSHKETEDGHGFHIHLTIPRFI